MSPLDLIAILMLSGYAVYKQTTVAEVRTKLSRFTMAAVYAGAGLVVGGINTPAGVGGWVLIILSVTLSVGVGLLRGHFTRVWVEGSTVWRRGTPVTVALFVGLIAAKFGLGAAAYLLHINDGAGFGEVLIMIAVMIAVQAEMLRRRAAQLTLASGRAADALV